MDSKWSKLYLLLTVYVYQIVVFVLNYRTKNNKTQEVTLDAKVKWIVSTNRSVKEKQQSNKDRL